MINLSALKLNVSRFAFIFFNRSGLSTLLNHMSSQGVSNKYIYHDTDQNNIVYHILRKDNFNLLALGDFNPDWTTGFKLFS